MKVLERAKEKLTKVKFLNKTFDLAALWQPSLPFTVSWEGMTQKLAESKILSVEVPEIPFE